ncbi:uncharacterized protein Tco025E_02421 [Trypanosoma conorhini]|uniref:BRCT domain-containing protein n=1 Tax=Trypanosoma conorhini TaxID=83891 RepID=A0A3R7LD80_9TRYP|nr:uncharacterized protein Tco025E_02421 [Trypanosoma conorhini]RNF24906.1 hypothetical protein Tco025E_02421 [Trypanosoma conorhini]
MFFPSPSPSLLTPSVAPFAGVRVFLHIREGTSGAGEDRTKHYAKKALRRLGAALTLSEATADLIVFHCGNESFLENATARGKTVVTPAYLQECAKCMERLSAEAFLVHGRLGHAEGRGDAAVAGSGEAAAAAEEEEGEPPRAELPPKTTSTGLSTVPYLDDDDDDARGRRTTARRAVAPAAKGRDPSDEGAVASASSATAKRSRGSSTDGAPPVGRRKRACCALGGTSDEHSTGAPRKGTHMAPNRKVAPAANGGATEPTASPTDSRRGVSHLRRPTTPPQLRIAVAGEDEGDIQFLCDVVEQLGGVCLSRVFGRVRKPTHLVLGGRGELTPMVLLAKALGIPVLTPQWLYDAISLGEFPEVLPAHLHPIYSASVRPTDSRGGGKKEQEEDKYGGTPTHLPRREPSIEDSLVGMFEQDVGPNYKPIFLGMVFAFVSHSPLVHADQFMELVRTLGGFVTRSALSLNLSVLVDLGYGTAAPQEGEEKNKCEKEKPGEVARAAGASRRRPRRGAVRRVEEAGAALETQSIPLTYQTALSGCAGRGGVTRHASHDVLQRLMAQRRQHELPAVPVVSVEWVIQCILLGEATETAPFEVPLGPQEGSGVAAVDHAKATEDAASGNGLKAAASTPPRQTARCFGEDSGRGRVSWQTPVVTSPFAKTSEGPSSAMKRAEQQLNTQQLLLSLDSDDD